MDDFKKIGEVFQWLILEIIFWWPTAIFIAVLLWDIRINLYVAEELIVRTHSALPIVDFAMAFYKNAMIVFAVALLVVYATRKIFPGWFFFIAVSGISNRKTSYSIYARIRDATGIGKHQFNIYWARTYLA